MRLKKAELVAKQDEADQKEADEAAKKAAKKKKDEEAGQKAKAEEERQAEEAGQKAGKAGLLDISCSYVNALLRPVEELMDGVLGTTLDPLTGRLHLTVITP